jgi:hypothetical protein
MLKRLRAPSPPLVISVIALFVALGGTTYAATSLPANSVGTAQLQSNAVTAAKIANGAVVPSKISAAGLAWHEVGAVGQPPFENGWTGSGLSYFTTPAFFKDPFGVVHLKGFVKSGTIATAAFTLPVGYRPAHELDEVVIQSPNTAADLYIGFDGKVVVDTTSNAPASLDGVTFRAGE